MMNMYYGESQLLSIADERWKGKMCKQMKITPGTLKDRQMGIQTDPCHQEVVKEKICVRKSIKISSSFLFDMCKLNTSFDIRSCDEISKYSEELSFPCLRFMDEEIN